MSYKFCNKLVIWLMSSILKELYFLYSSFTNAIARIWHKKEIPETIISEVGSNASVKFK